MRICRATVNDAEILAGLAARMWDTPASELKEMYTAVTADRREAACFLAFQDDVPIGFAQCQLRHDYVEGTDSTPVGYLEGIYVQEPFRRHGIARLLLRECESWARQQGCTEFASDCELDNHSSLEFHLRSGFTEANRIICFTKRL